MKKFVTLFILIGSLIMCQSCYAGESPYKGDDAIRIVQPSKHSAEEIKSKLNYNPIIDTSLIVKEADVILFNDYWQPKNPAFVYKNQGDDSDSVVLLPFREVIEYVGGTIQWNQRDSSFTVKLGSHSVSQKIGVQYGYADGKLIWLSDSHAYVYVKDGVLYTGGRWFKNAFGWYYDDAKVKDEKTGDLKAFGVILSKDFAGISYKYFKSENVYNYFQDVKKKCLSGTYKKDKPLHMGKDAINENYFELRLGESSHVSQERKELSLPAIYDVNDSQFKYVFGGSVDLGIFGVLPMFNNFAYEVGLKDPDTNQILYDDNRSIFNTTIMYPLEDIINFVGGEFSYNNDSETFSLKLGDLDIKQKLGVSYAIIDDNKYYLSLDFVEKETDYLPVMKDGVIYVSDVWLENAFGWCNLNYGISGKFYGWSRSGDVDVSTKNNVSRVHFSGICISGDFDSANFITEKGYFDTIVEVFNLNEF